MKDKLRMYVNKLLTYLPVAIFIFTLVFFINISATVSELKTEFGVDAIDELIGIYKFYFFRTFILALFIPFYDTVLTNTKLSYRKASAIHFALIIITVGVLYYRPGSPIQAVLIILGMCTIIYTIVRVVIHYREKEFISNANEIFRRNTK